MAINTDADRDAERIRNFLLSRGYKISAPREEGRSSSFTGYWFIESYENDVLEIEVEKEVRADDVWITLMARPVGLQLTMHPWMVEIGAVQEPGDAEWDSYNQASLLISRLDDIERILRSDSMFEVLGRLYKRMADEYAVRFSINSQEFEKFRNAGQPGQLSPEFMEFLQQKYGFE